MPAPTPARIAAPMAADFRRRRPAQRDAERIGPDLAPDVRARAATADIGDLQRYPGRVLQRFEGPAHREGDTLHDAAHHFGGPRPIVQPRKDAARCTVPDRRPLALQMRQEQRHRRRRSNAAGQQRHVLGRPAQHGAEPAQRRAAGLGRRRMHDDALIGRKEDHPRRRVDPRRDDAGNFAGAALVHGVAIAGHADPEHATPGVHCPDHHRHAGAGQPVLHPAGHVAESKERRQSPGGPGHEIEQWRDITSLVDESHCRNRIAADRAGELHDAIVLGQQHVSRGGVDLGLRAPDMRHARQRVAGIDGHRTTEPVELLLRRDPPIEFGRVGRRTPVLPDDGRQQRVTRCIDEHMRIDLRTDADAGKTPQIVCGRELGECREDTRHPVARILLGMTGRRPQHGVRPRERGEPAAGFVDQDRLGRRGADIDADQAGSRHAIPQMLIAACGPVPYSALRRKENNRLRRAAQRQGE